MNCSSAKACYTAQQAKRKAQSARRTRRLALLAAAAIFTGTAVPAGADCGVLPFSTAQPIVEGFLFGRKPLLADYPNGGPDVVRTVAIIAMSSKAALPKLVEWGNCAI